jgi:uncharacterized protein (UPF0332 family)
MTDKQRQLLVKAGESLRAARLLLDGGYADIAASRAYYAMFYIAEAYLEGEGLSFSKHSAVISGFGNHFARTGRVPAEFHKALIAGFDARNEADYTLLPTVTPQEAEGLIAQGEAFLQRAEKDIEPK